MKWSSAQKRTMNSRGWRMKTLRLFFLVFVGLIVLRLFSLQVVSAGFYDQLASGQHSFYKELFAERGEIFVRDWKTGEEFLAATNEPRAFIYAEPRKIEDPEMTAYAIGELLGYERPEKVVKEEVVEEKKTVTDILDGIESSEEEDIEEITGDDLDGEMKEDVPSNDEETTDEENEKENEITLLIERFSKENDPYEPVARNVDEETLDRILELDLPGIYYVLEDGRSYPEGTLGGHVFGFVGRNQDGEAVGSYGVEGYFDEFLSGENGYLDTETDSSGRWIGVAARNFQPAQDGGDIVLTIDRTIQHIVCDQLQRGVEYYNADGGSVVVLEPKTGRVMAMCSVPNFDPNTYSEVEDISVYNNAAIFDAYEPGSVFKPLVMAAALDQGAISPTSTFNDTGEEKIDVYTIRNSDLKAHGLVTMTEVLQESLNTGMIYVMRTIGGEKMLSYIEDFGFGELTGIQINSESPGTINSLYKDSEIYYATASYGQGITTTVLQLASAYAAMANGGVLMQPYIVDELRHPDGYVEKMKPQTVRQVISNKTATTIGAMLVSVVEEGHATQAGVQGYYIAGKTGTAQVASTNGVGYQAGVTKATFAGFGPVEDPAFAMVVMLDHPRKSQWAADTAAPLFGDIADFLVQYLEIAPRRSEE